MKFINSLTSFLPPISSYVEDKEGENKHGIDADWDIVTYEGSDAFIKEQIMTYFNSILYALMKFKYQPDDEEVDWSVDFDPDWFINFYQTKIITKFIDQHSQFNKFINEPFYSEEKNDEVILNYNDNLPFYLQPLYHPGHGATMLDDVKLRFKEQFKIFNPVVQSATRSATKGIADASSLVDKAWNSEISTKTTQQLHETSQTIFSGMSNFWSSAKNKLVFYY